MSQDRPIEANAAIIVSGGFTPATLFGTYSGFWLDANVGTCSDQAGTTPVTSDGTTILNWKDQSGNARNFSIAANGPIRKNSIVNSLPVIRFVAANTDELVGSSIAAFTSGEIFAIIKINNDPAADAASGIWHLGADAAADHYSWIDSFIYDGFGSTVRKTVGDPATNLAAFNLVNVWSDSSDYAYLINGTSFFTTGTNTVGFSTTPEIGGTAAQGKWLDGDIAEIICFNAKITAGERTSLKAWFATKYGLTIA